MRPADERRSSRRAASTPPERSRTPVLTSRRDRAPSEQARRGPTDRSPSGHGTPPRRPPRSQGRPRTSDATSPVDDDSADRRETCGLRAPVPVIKRPASSRFTIFGGRVSSCRATLTSPAPRSAADGNWSTRTATTVADRSELRRARARLDRDRRSPSDLVCRSSPAPRRRVSSSGTGASSAATEISVESSAVNTRSPVILPVARRSSAASSAAPTSACGAADLHPGQLGAHRDLGLRLRAPDADQGGGDGVDHRRVGGSGRAELGHRRPRRAVDRGVAPPRPDLLGDVRAGTAPAAAAGRRGRSPGWRAPSRSAAAVPSVVGALLDQLEVVVAELPEELLGDLERGRVVVGLERVGGLGDHARAAGRGGRSRSAR